MSLNLFKYEIMILKGSLHLESVLFLTYIPHVYQCKCAYWVGPY